MSKEEKEAVKEYVKNKQTNVSEYVRELVLREINYTSTL
jgi:hypothetical protein